MDFSLATSVSQYASRASNSLCSDRGWLLAATRALYSRRGRTDQFQGIARLLHSLSQLPTTTKADRAWKQVDIIFRRHNGEDMLMQDVPAWRLIERLCDIAMYAHPSRAHQGTAYVVRQQRPEDPESRVPGTELGILQYAGLGATPWNSPPGAGVQHNPLPPNPLLYPSTDSSTFQP